MASRFPSAPPAWLKVAAIILILWGLMGCASLYMHFAVGAGPDASDYDRKLYDSLPAALDLVYVLAVGGGLFGAIALLLRKRQAVLLSTISLVSVIIQFGYMFLATDIIAMKGVWTTYFPAAIIVVQAVQFYIARTARARGWLS